MRVSRETKARHHQEIVQHASVMLRARGIDGLSVVEIMQAAGFTHGGFYRHFESKDALIAEAVLAIFDGIADRLEGEMTAKGAKAGVAEFAARYLSLAHVQNPGSGCPIAAFGTDIGRQSMQVRTAYTRGFERMISLLAQGMEGRPSSRRNKARTLIMLMVGTVVTLRASDQSEGSMELLTVARQFVHRLTGG
jgi:TetR/AcrR family transcriptional repressor of nem operon